MIPLFKVSMAPETPKRVEETLLSGYIGEGPRVAEFEKALERELDKWPILCTNSCTSALDLAYHLIGLGEGDPVISTPMTCLATNMPLALRGCNIRWADVDPLTGNIDPHSVERLRKQSYMGKAVKAIVCTDWGGRPCDYDLIREAAPGIPIVEDAAHAFGSRHSSVRGGDYIAWSFQAIKHLTTGDGGALKVPPHEYERARLLRWYGLDRNDSTAMRCVQQASEPGFKYQMNDITATIGLENLKPPHLWELSLTNAKYYDLHLPEHVRAPFDPRSAYWLYTILVDDPGVFEKEMAVAGIQASQVHTRNDVQHCLPDSGHPLPGLDAFSAHMISIPVGWWLSEDDLKHIIREVTRVAEKELVGAV